MNTIVTTNTEVVTLEIPTKHTITTTVTEKITVDTTNTNNIVLVEPSAIVETITQQHSVVSSGTQGPQGIPGQSTSYIYMLAGSTLGGSRAVASLPNGTVGYPIENAPILGITTGATVVGGVVEIQITGLMQEPSWNFTLGLPIFIGTEGTLTQIEPETGLLCIIAEPILSNKIFIDKQTAFWR